MNYEEEDEIRESIPCDDEGWPIGYHSTKQALYWRGRLVYGHVASYEEVWEHAISREKARRQRASQQTHTNQVRRADDTNLTIHNRKTTPEFFEDVRTGLKTFEIRDVDPEVGPMKVDDVLVLKEWDGEKYTGRVEVRNVSYVLVGPYRDLIPEGTQIVGMTIPDTLKFVEGQPTLVNKATEMLSEVIRERDGLLTMLENEHGAVIIARMERDELKAKLAEVTKDRNALLLENEEIRDGRDRAEESERKMSAAFGVAVYERDELRKEVNALRKGVGKGNEAPTEVARNPLSVDLSSEHNVIKRNFDTCVTIQVQDILEQVRDNFYSSIESLDRDSISAYLDGVEKGLNDIETAFVVNSQLCESRRQKIEELTREMDRLLEALSQIKEVTHAE